MEEEKKKLKISLEYNSPVVLTFALISLVVLVLGEITDNATTLAAFCVYRSPISFLWFVRIFGHVLGHGGWEHYLNNMMMLLLIGPMLEEKYGSAVMIELICITAFLTGLVNILIFPETILLGASGIVFMMIVMSSITSVKKGQIPLTLIVVVVLYLGQQVLAGLFDEDNISQLTHIIGGVLGGVYGLVLQDKKE